jgi:hypothetical protein
VWSKDGLRSPHGGEQATNPQAGWRDPATVADRDTVGKLLKWRLTDTVDLLRNRIEYSYVPGGARDTQFYLLEIRYADYDEGGEIAYLVSVRVIYEPRPDPVSHRRGGFEVRKTKRCTLIKCWVNTGTPVLVRTVHLECADPGAADTVGNGFSLLHRIQVVGNDGASSQAMPPLESGYSTWFPKHTDTSRLPAANSPGPTAHSDTSLWNCSTSSARAYRRWRKLRAVPATGAMWAVHTSIRRTLFRSSRLVLGSAIRRSKSRTSTHGRPDLLVTDSTGDGYYPLGTSGGFDQKGNARRLQQAPAISLTDPLVRPVDTPTAMACRTCSAPVTRSSCFTTSVMGSVVSGCDRALACRRSPSPTCM